MTIYVAFTPANNASPPFSATVTLDGGTYTLSVFWNIYRPGWYYSLTDQSGSVAITAALIASPPTANIYLAPGVLATSTLLYRDGTGNFEITP